MAGSHDVHGLHVTANAALHRVIQGNVALLVSASHQGVDAGACKRGVRVQITDYLRVGVDLGCLDIGLPPLLDADLGHVGEELGAHVAPVVGHVAVEHQKVLAEILLAFLRADLGLDLEGELGAKHRRDIALLE